LLTLAVQSFGVQVWLPETCGPVGLAEPDHQALLLMLGHQSEREVLRNRFRTTAAWRAFVAVGTMGGGESWDGHQMTAKRQPATPTGVWRWISGRKRSECWCAPTGFE
jgi:hypothetical protein